MSSSWEEKWAAGRTRWDQGSAHPQLAAFLKGEKGRELVPSQGTALVPACGTGYDVHLFASHGLDAIGIDISPTAGEAARKWLSIQPKTPASTSIIVGDFFAWAHDASSPKARVILDYTWLCALPPADRPKWKASLAAIAQQDSDTTLITLMFPLNVPNDSDGPPYPLSLDLYHDLLDEHWALVHLEDVDKATGQGRHTGPSGDEKLGLWKWKV